MWLLTRWPAARAAMSESSPARTVAHTTRASCRAFSPGHSWLAPCTPSIWIHTHTHKSPKYLYVRVWLYVCVQRHQYMFTYLKTGLLGGQVGATSHGTQLYRRHSATDVEVLACWPWCLHQGDAVAAAHWLRWILEDTHKPNNTMRWHKKMMELIFLQLWKSLSLRIPHSTSSFSIHSFPKWLLTGVLFSQFVFMLDLCNTFCFSNVCLVTCM